MRVDVDPDVPPTPAVRRFEPAALLAVFGGGCVGGLARYVATQEWPASGRGIPWSVFVVNTGGAFVLAVVASLALARGWRFRRLLLGTGFCGALTTFSAVVVATDELIAHGRLGIGIGYVALTAAAAVLATYLGIAATRRLMSASSC